MAKKITYLLGAGASADTIPVVSKMNDRIIRIANYLENHLKKQNTKTDQERSRILNEIIEDFKWLVNESINYYSIDTLAKKYYLVGNSADYERLKKCLIIYLTIEQYCIIGSEYENEITLGRSLAFVKHATDKRYDSFIAAIGNTDKNGLKLNGNIKILSWNYDLQFELSLKRFTNKEINDIKKKYQILPLLNEHSQNDPNKLVIDEFSLRKINGNAIFDTNTTNASKATVFDYILPNNDNENRLITLLNELSRFDFHNNIAARHFHFAWETDSYFEKEFGGRKSKWHAENLLQAEKIAEETEILVIVGYSFPIFNREIDNRLFNKMNKLRKVYVQDVNAEKIKSTITNAFRVLQTTREVGKYKSVSSSMTSATETKEYFEIPIVEILTETSVDQFIIPYELHNE